MVRQWVLPIFLALVSMGSVAKDKVQIDPNFMVVLREVNGANKEDFGYKQIPPSSVTLPNGESFTTSAFTQFKGISRLIIESIACELPVRSR